MGYAVPGYDIGAYSVDDAVVTPPTPGVVVVGDIIVLPAPGQARSATSYGDPGGVNVIYHQNPGPYSDEVVFMLRTWAGQRLFGKKMPSEQIGADVINRYDTLISVSGFGTTTVPLGNDLIGSIGMTEGGRGSVVLDNRDGFWSRLVYVEPLLCMPVGIWNHFGGGDVHLVFQGQVERVVITMETVTLECSEP